MRYAPIIFSTAMVRANHDGRKNQTRRLNGLDYVNGLPDTYRYDGISEDNPTEHWFEKLDKGGNPTEIYTPVICPYGQVGDVLWVREAFAHTKQLNLAPDDENYGFVYKAEDESILWNDIEGWRWRPSIHMPIEACRSWCIITSIECQRLQDITEGDAIMEGIEGYDEYHYKMYLDNGGAEKTKMPERSFMSLWESIHGTNSWLANPWVWVARYEHTTIPPAGWDEHVKAIAAKRRGK